MEQIKEIDGREDDQGLTQALSIFSFVGGGGSVALCTEHGIKILKSKR